MKPCSHVVCKTCTDSLVRSARQCVVCDHKLESGDIVELKREGMKLSSFRTYLLTVDALLNEGTGYAGGGIAETSKKGVAFQG